MKVILIEDVSSLGSVGQTLNVKDGYARNYLIPKGKALPATAENVSRMQELKKRHQSMETKVRAEAERFAEQLSGHSLTLARKVGETEKLFGSVTSLDIQRALEEEGIELDRKKIMLEEPIKSLGIYRVPVKLHPEVTAQVTVWVVQE